MLKNWWCHRWCT